MILNFKLFFTASDSLFKNVIGGILFLFLCPTFLLLVCDFHDFYQFMMKWSSYE